MTLTDASPHVPGFVATAAGRHGSGWEVVPVKQPRWHPTVVRWETDHRGQSYLHLGQSDPNVLYRFGQIEPLIQRSVDAGLPRNAEVMLNLGDGSEADGLALCSYKAADTLVPDSEFLGSRAYDDMRQYWAAHIAPLEDRLPVAFWRGGTSGQSPTGDWRDLPRVALCRIAQQRPDLFDVGISHVAQIPPEAEAELADMNLLRPATPPAALRGFRYQIDIDGNSNAWSGLFLKLLSGSPVLKVASAGGWRQWYYDRLVPWTHYVPVLPDLTDLVEKVEWLRAHPDEAQGIGAAGQAVAQSMTYDTELAIGVQAVVSAFGQRRRPNQLAATVMEQLHGGDIYAGFQPAMPLDLQGWNSFHPCFARLVADSQASVVIDVGVWKGGSTLAFARLLRERRDSGVVIGVDTFLGSAEHAMPGLGLFGLIRRLNGRPMLYEQFLSNVVLSGLEAHVVPMPQTSGNAALILGAAGIAADIVHIDAAHDYAHVVQDIAAYWPLVRPGGFLVGDDYCDSWPGVVRAADEFARAAGLPIRVEEPKWIIQKPLG